MWLKKIGIGVDGGKRKVSLRGMLRLRNYINVEKKRLLKGK